MNFLPTEIIKAKRNGENLSEEQIQQFISGYSRGMIPDYQMSALLMAIYFRGMSQQETLALTKSMLHSGEVVDLSAIKGFKVDKHSTGGVGDKTSLILAPIVAACDVNVPMISGRGLAHTGGTLDKLESIPGFHTQKSLSEFASLIREYHIGFIGQTKEICPADRKMYALRDVTATVDSLPLICASIMSKKLAEGIDGLVLDVKFGSGAFMKELKDAENLAIQLMGIAKGYGKKVVSILSSMDQPLGRYAGNALEVLECVEIMKGISHPQYNDTRELSLQLSAQMLLLAGKVKTAEEGYALANTALSSGLAFKKFQQICRAQGGDISKLPLPKEKTVVKTDASGFIEHFNTETIGIVGLIIHAGRSQIADQIAPESGIEFHFKIGDSVKVGDILFTLHGNNLGLLESAIPLLKSSVKLNKQSVKKSKLIAKILN